MTDKLVNMWVRTTCGVSQFVSEDVLFLLKRWLSIVGFPDFGGDDLYSEAPFRVHEVRHQSLRLKLSVFGSNCGYHKIKIKAGED